MFPPQQSAGLARSLRRTHDRSRMGHAGSGAPLQEKGFLITLDREPWKEKKNLPTWLHHEAALGVAGSFTC